MSNTSYDVIVVGSGGMGSAAALALARRGRRVLALEQLALGHDQGSSHGQTRIIRKAYFEHPAYVPLVCRAYEGWYDLEQRQGRHLLTECACLSIGPPDGELVAGVLRSAQEHALPVERLSAAELRTRFPTFRFGDGSAGVLERSAGFLLVDDCVRAQAHEAVRLGATLRENEPVLSWEADGRGIIVRTAADWFGADRLVLTAGPWTARLLGRWGAQLTVMRQVVLWFGTQDDGLFRRDRFPIFITETPEGHFYGLPVLDAAGLKVARHYGALEVRDPVEVERSMAPADEEAVRAFLCAHLPAVNGPRRRVSVCLYTLTPDRHFLIDVHPEHANVVLASGFSGHGFKFAPVVGEILADLAEKGRTDWPIELFRIGRFAPGVGERRV